MGSLLTPLYAHIFVTYIEKSIFRLSSAKRHIHFWFGYVNDVIACFDGILRQFIRFLNEINYIYPKTKFTIGVEKNNSLTFLNLKLIHLESKIIFDIFIKTTNANTTLP